MCRGSMELPGVEIAKNWRVAAPAGMGTKETNAYEGHYEVRQRWNPRLSYCQKHDLGNLWTQLKNDVPSLLCRYGANVTHGGQWDIIEVTDRDSAETPS